MTKDLGRRFAVRAYPEDSVARVVVAEGKVALRPADAPAGSGTALSHGDLGGLDAGSSNGCHFAAAGSCPSARTLSAPWPPTHA